MFSSTYYIFLFCITNLLLAASLLVHYYASNALLRGGLVTMLVTMLVTRQCSDEAVTL